MKWVSANTIHLLLKSQVHAKPTFSRALSHLSRGGLTQPASPEEAGSTGLGPTEDEAVNKRAHDILWGGTQYLCQEPRKSAYFPDQ